MSKLSRIDGEVIFDEGHAAGLWRYQFEKVVILGHPPDELCDVARQHLPTAGEDGLAAFGLQGNAGHDLADGGGGDRGVILALPGTVDLGRGTDKPADAQPR